MHSNKFITTWHHRNPNLMIERIDYLLISSALIENISISGINPSFASDHTSSWINLILEVEGESGRGYWKLNTYILEDEQTMKELKEKLIDLKGQSMDRENKLQALERKPFLIRFM